MKVLVGNQSIDKAEHLHSCEHQVITHLVLKEGQDLPRHHVPMTVVVVPIRGKILFTGEDSKEEITPGCVVRMRPDEPHDLHALEDSELMVIKSRLQ